MRDDFLELSLAVVESFEEMIGMELFIQDGEVGQERFSDELVEHREGGRKELKLTLGLQET